MVSEREDRWANGVIAEATVEGNVLRSLLWSTHVTAHAQSLHGLIPHCQVNFVWQAILHHT